MSNLRSMEKSSAIEYINKMFPTEASLSGIEPLMQKVHNEIHRVDASILAAVRQQSTSGSKAQEDLSAATSAVKELMYKIREIKTKAEQSETMVQEICRDIKKLDCAKKHLTTAITGLHRLTMLVSAVEQLQMLSSKRQYKEAAAQLEAVNQLSSYFEPYKDVPKIADLREKFKNIKQMLKSHVLSDFSSLGTGKETEEPNLLQQLSDACLVVDGLEPSVREELVQCFCNRELTSYRQIFGGAELARLDKAERRYAWIKRRLRTNEEIWKIFPASWHVPYLLCIQFCKLTRTQLVEILDKVKDKPDVATLLLALQRTLEFEEEIAEKFGGSTQSDENSSDADSESQSVLNIKRKYERKFAAHQRAGNEEKDGRKDYSPPAAGFNFQGIISSCFEPHLAVYVELEEKTLMENLDKLVQEETWEAEEGSQTNILSSSMQVFLIIRRSLKRCSALTKNETLFNLFKVFQNLLKAYATKLSAKLPKGGTGIVAAATGTDGQIKTSERDERVICYIVNTAEYCHKTSGELAENISKVIDPQFSEHVDMSEVQDEFSSVITKALMTLVQGLETKFDAEMAAMTRVPWVTLESVGDQSMYVNCIHTIITTSIPVLGSLLSPVYFQFFMDKVELQKVGISQGLSSASLEPGVSSATTSSSFRIRLSSGFVTFTIHAAVFSLATTSLSFGIGAWSVAIQPSSNPAMSGITELDDNDDEFMQFAQSLGPRFYLNIFKCKQISETGAQQMLLDAQAMKTILLEVPSLGRQKSGAPTSYSKFVSREMSKAEALLKVILSPVDSVEDTYRALLPEGTPAEFQRILELKGFKKADQQTILDDFNKHGPTIKPPPTAADPPAAPVSTGSSPSEPTPPLPPPPPVPSPSTVGANASREDVLTRAAALGRGAATTGFKRFLALTEAAKDRNDGPFRKLFNA